VRRSTNVNAHELASMVWDLVTAQSGKHHLQEGFATYYAALAEREIYGDDYFILNYTKQRSKLNMLLERIRFRFSMKRQVP
jgi:aminopeptidase N